MEHDARRCSNCCFSTKEGEAVYCAWGRQDQLFPPHWIYRLIRHKWFVAVAHEEIAKSCACFRKKEAANEQA